MAEFFARMDVRQVDFNGWEACCRDRVTDRDAGVSVGGGVEEDDVPRAGRLLDPGDQVAFMIGLAELQNVAVPGGCLAELAFDFGEALIAVNRRFATSEEIQIGAVENQDVHRGWEEWWPAISRREWC